MFENLEREIENAGNAEKAKVLAKYFRTEKGEYGEGDIFLGILVPVCRNIAKKYDLPLSGVEMLLQSVEHEKRLIALFILTNLYKKSVNKKATVDFYLSHTKYINNWDLVDLTAYHIVGDYLQRFSNDYNLLILLSDSKSIWERRIAIISTMSFIRKFNFQPTLEISERLLKNEHDLINKAVGWMLREVGKRDLNILRSFLNNNISKISSITLSYATEKMSTDERTHYRQMRKTCKE